MENGKLSLEIEIDVQTVLTTIKEANTLDDNQALFSGLASIAVEKAKLKDALEQVEVVEYAAKQAINDRAKALIGADWTVVKGEGYKITRSPNGAVYELVPVVDEATGEIIKEADPEFTKITVAPNSDTIDAYREANSTLPDCIAVNEKRGETIKITVKPL